MQYYLLFIVIPVVIISIIRSVRRNAQAAKYADEQISGSMPDPVVRKEIRPANVQAAQPNLKADMHAEGKSTLEIDMDRAKIRTEEHKSIRLEETRREIMEVDLAHLRSAVVMSEILDRPVSLRRRNYPR